MHMQQGNLEKQYTANRKLTNLFYNAHNNLNLKPTKLCEGMCVCVLTQPQDFQLIAMLACKHETCPALVALWLGNCNARVPVWTRRRLKPSAFPGVDRLLISVNTSSASDPVLVAWLLMLLTCHCFLALRRQHLETPCGHA